MKTVYLIYACNNPLAPHFPESSLSLAGMLLKEGFKVRITDTTITPKNEWSFEDPLFFGFTVYSNAGIGSALNLAKDLRDRFPGTPLLWGGPHAQMVPEQTAEHPYVDAVCVDEGEFVIRDVAHMIAEGRWNPEEIRGLVYKDKNGMVVRTPSQELIDLDTIPYHPYELLDLKGYFVSTIKGYYQSSRGCPHSCTFCAKTQQRRWRPKSPGIVVDHVERMVKEFGIRELYFSDANFFVDLRRVRSICNCLLEKNINIRWSAFCRCDTIMRMDEAFLNLLKSSGCTQLDIGGESGSDYVLKEFSKGISRADIIASVDKLSRAGIRPELSFVIGAPMEKDQDFKQTISLVTTIRDKYPTASINGIFQFQPYPNSTLGDRTIREWRLPIPENLEEWQKHPINLPRRSYFPWLDHQRYSRMITTSYIASYLFYYDRLFTSVEGRLLHKSYGWLVFKGMLKVAHNLVIRHLIRLRWNLGFMKFPLEWRLFGLIRDRVFGLI